MAAITERPGSTAYNQLADPLTSPVALDPLVVLAHADALGAALRFTAKGLAGAFCGIDFPFNALRLGLIFSAPAAVRSFYNSAAGLVKNHGTAEDVVTGGVEFLNSAGGLCDTTGTSIAWAVTAFNITGAVVNAIGPLFMVKGMVTIPYLALQLDQLEESIKFQDWLDRAANEGGLDGMVTFLSKNEDKISDNFGVEGELLNPILGAINKYGDEAVKNETVNVLQGRLSKTIESKRLAILAGVIGLVALACLLFPPSAAVLTLGYLLYGALCTYTVISLIDEHQSKKEFVNEICKLYIEAIKKHLPVPVETEDRGLRTTEYSPPEIEMTELPNDYNGKI